MNALEQYSERLREKTSYADQSQIIYRRIPLYAPFRIYPATAVPAGRHVLFDRTAAAAGWGTSLGWGSGTGGAVIDKVDFPRYFNLQNAVMPKDKLYVARTLGLHWVGRAPGASGAMNATFAYDKNIIQNEPAFIEIRPEDKEVEMDKRLNLIGDVMFDNVREIGTPAVANLTSADHYSMDDSGGRWKLYPDDETPGIMFSSDHLFNVTFNNEFSITGGTITGALQIYFVFDGWYFSPL